MSMERLKRPESRSRAEPLASVEAFEGFEAFEGQFRATRKGFGARSMAEPLASVEVFEGFEGQFRATRKKRFGAPEPRAHSLRNSAHSLAQSQSPQSSKCEVLERLKRPWSV